MEFWRLWMQALRHTQPHLLAYLVYMVQRLMQMKTILRPTGSIYLHCDPTASHYIKVMMDAIFGHTKFRNEIIWSYRTGGVGKRWYARKHDVVLFYTNGKTHTFNLQKERSYSTGNTPPGVRGIKKYQDEHGRWYTMASLRDVWTDINAIGRTSKERLGYPTQKPLKLLRRIIQVSSNEGDTVFDPFCGCGTTVYAASELNRRWIGCDIAILAIRLVRETLKERQDVIEDRHFEIDGIPVSVEQAQILFRKDPFQFQHWIIERAGGLPSARKTADRGIDGWLFFEIHNNQIHEMVLSVKGGHIRPTDIRDLRGVLEREPRAELAGFLSMRPATPAMRREAAAAGVYSYMDRDYDRIQLLTAEEVLNGQEFKVPFKVGTKIHTGQQIFDF